MAADNNNNNNSGPASTVSIHPFPSPSAGRRPSHACLSVSLYGHPLALSSIELGLGGAYIASIASIPIGAVVVLTLSATGGPPRVTTARVVRQRHGGVELSYLRPDSDFLRALATALRTPTWSPATDANAAADANVVAVDFRRRRIAGASLNG